MPRGLFVSQRTNAASTLPYLPYSRLGHGLEQDFRGDDGQRWLTEALKAETNYADTQIATFDARWQEQVSNDWRQRYENVQRGHGRLIELDGLASERALVCDESRVARASRAQAPAGTAAARARVPCDAPVRLAYARPCRTSAEDDSVARRVSARCHGRTRRRRQCELPAPVRQSERFTVVLKTSTGSVGAHFTRRQRVCRDIPPHDAGVPPAHADCA